MAPTSTLPIPAGAATLVARWENEIDEASRRRDLADLNRQRDHYARSCVIALNDGGVEAATIFARISAHAETCAERVRAELLESSKRTLHRPFAVTEQLSAVDA